MELKSLGFIGGGRVTRIFLQAFKNVQAEHGNVIVYDNNRDVLSSLKSEFPEIEIVESHEFASRQEIVFIAVHPPVIKEVLEKMKQYVTADSIVVSLAPKILIDNIAGELGINNVARMIPNATSYINEGFNPLCFSEDFGEMKKLLLDLLNALGNTFEVPEEKLEAYAIISAMLPTYFWFQWKIMVDLGIRMGMHDVEARDAVYETLIAALNTMFKSGISADEVMDLIPVKPIGTVEDQITGIYNDKLWTLYEKLKP
ncbi:MAG: pyrroline-5-carboxylate reductase family protein [Bacteroidales bacterium]